MDFKKMLMDLAEAQANKMQDDMMSFLQSEEFEKQLAEKMDAMVDIPFVKDEREAKFFKAVASVFVDVAAGLFPAK